MSENSPKLTDVELEIMHRVWDLGTCTVREVYEAMRERREIAYTTVMTMMNILETKGHLRKNKKGRAYVYQPIQPKTTVISSLVEDFIGRVFHGSAQPLVLGLVKDRKLSEKDLAEIARIIEESS